MAEMLSVAGAVLFTAAGVSAAVATVLWFMLGIPSVVRDLAVRSYISRGRGRRPGSKGQDYPEQAGGKAEPVEIMLLEEIVYIHTEEEI